MLYKSLHLLVSTLASGKKVNFMEKVSFISKMDPTMKALSPTILLMEKGGIFSIMDAFMKEK